MLGQWTSYSPGQVRLHGHAEAHFMYVPPGVAYETVACGTRIPTGANLVYNPPGTWHCDRLLKHGRFFTITVTDKSDEWSSRALPETPMQMGDPAAHKAIAQLIGSFHGDVLHLESLCLELLGAATKSQKDEPRLPAWMKRAVALLNDCPKHDQTVGSIAAEVGVHPVHLARGFRRFCGSTPGQYLLSLRLDLAARLLAEDHLSVAEIALECGFADQSHFTRQFGRAFGIPPRRFRTAASNVAF